MKDRNKGYVPEPPTDTSPLNPHFTTLIGDPWREPDPDLGPQTQVMPVALGKADELNREEWWEWAQVSDGSDREEHWTHFEGHAVRVSFGFRAWNYREVNDWKGRDEVRKAGVYEIAFNEQIVYGDMYSDPLEACLLIRQKIKAVQALPINWRCPGEEYRGLIEGRRVFYKDKPATLGYWMPDQGAVMIEPLDPREQLDDYYEDSDVKDDILTPHLFWFRDENQTERERF